MKFFFFVANFFNRFEKTQKWFGWLLEIIIFVQGLLMWMSQKEFRSLADCVFFSRKQAHHPWVNERAVEYPWAYNHIADIKFAKVLDVGAKEGLPITDMLLENQNVVYAIDIRAAITPGTGNLIIEKGDILSTSFEDNFFDAIIAISTLEHIGITGRYGILVSNEVGDFQAMREIFRILKPGGKVLITVPYGSGKSLPLNRLYDASRIGRLFEGFEITREQYFKFHAKYKMWLEVNENIASRNNWDQEPWYALACFCALKPAHP